MTACNGVHLTGETLARYRRAWTALEAIAAERDLLDGAGLEPLTAAERQVVEVLRDGDGGGL